MIPMGWEVDYQLSQADKTILNEIFCLEASRNFYFFLLKLVGAPCNENMCANTLCNKEKGATGTYCQ